MNNRVLDLKHVDNNLKESLVYVYFGSIVNNPPKICRVQTVKLIQQVFSLKALITAVIDNILSIFFF